MKKRIYYKTTSGWIINPSKLKRDDRDYLKSLTSETEITNFVDECVVEYRSAFGIDIVDDNATWELTMGDIVI